MPDPIPFLLFVTVTAITPGPNNLMALSHACGGGMKNGLRFCFGVFFGMLAVMLACGMFSGALAAAVPEAEQAMKALGALYMLWIGWTLWNSGPASRHGAGADRRLFFQGLALQLVNPKIIIYGITAYSVFLLPVYRDTGPLALCAAFLATVGYLGTVAWALCGAGLEKLFHAHPKAVNRTLALLVAACALSMLR